MVGSATFIKVYFSNHKLRTGTTEIAVQKRIIDILGYPSAEDFKFKPAYKATFVVGIGSGDASLYNIPEVNSDPSCLDLIKVIFEFSTLYYFSLYFIILTLYYLLL